MLWTLRNKAWAGQLGKLAQDLNIEPHWFFIDYPEHLYPEWRIP